jgi:hypothetical protein
MPGTHSNTINRMRMAGSNTNTITTKRMGRKEAMRRR